MEFTSTHQPAAGPSTRAPAWHPSDSSQYGSGKRALSDGEGEGGESEEDDGKPGDELPKKRRRRQALSCTECKRRKIKCDRQHPCGPCVRRTEADKCHWNVVEPSDKYVLRTEWDGLQRRVEALERGKSEAGSYRRGDVAAGRGRSLEAREPNLDLARATGRSPSQTQIQPTIQDITTTRIARLEAFLATISPDAWARFQAEEVNQVAGLDEHGRRDEEKHSTARSHHMDWRPPRSEDGHSSVSMGSAWPGLSVRAPRSEPSVSPLIPTRREGGHSPFQSSSVHAPPHPHLHGQSSQHSPLPAHSISHSPATHSQEQYARPLLPRGPSDQFPTAPSVSHFPGRSLDGPLPGPRSLGIVPGFGGPKGEGTMSSRPMNESWDAHLSSRVLPPPLPSPRSRGSGASASSTVFSDRRPSDPSPLGKYDTLGGKGDCLNVKHIEPGSKHDREDDSGPPQVFLSFPMPNNSSERATLLASVLGKSETELEAGAIPSRSVCDKIVSFYFQRVSWNHNLIDPETFHRSYDDFFHSPSEKRHAPFIALLLTILCVGLGNMTPERATREGICKDLEHWKQRCDAYWRACQRALSANDVAQKKPIELAQTLVMLLYCNQSLDGNGWEYSAHFVAFAVRIAHSMGLSKLGSEPVGQVPPPGLRERELRRRVWWNIVFMDWYLSPMVGHSYLIHPAQCNTAHPANLNWDEMVDGRRFEPMDRNQWTESAFLIAKAEVAESVRELSDHINAGQALTRDFLLAYERRLNERLGLVATSLIQRDHLLERDDRVAWERIMFTFGLNNRAIRLHRRYMLRGYAVLEYRGSTEKCINAAKNTLHTYQEAQSIDFPGVTWWVVCMHSFAAAVILLMDQFYARTAIGGEMPTPAEMETRRRHIHQATRLLATVGEVNDLAMRCAHVLDILLDEVTRKRDAFAPPDVHPSPYTHLPPVEIGRLASATCHPTDADLTRWVATGLGSLSVPDGELQSAPVGARGLSAEVEKFWTRVFELDFPMNSPE